MANRLASSASPYLLQHQDNPVAWQPWDETALAEARRLNKPILLSIGYASCHWCHVMAHECFENETIARQMNEAFVCIKVDREQRPDLDAIYQAAVQALTGRGGWPLTVFLTPEGEPFYGGTYFPPEDRHGLPGLPRLLHALSQAWQQRPEDIRHQIGPLLAAVRQDDRVAGSDHADLDMHKAASIWLQQLDEINGGFGTAPKFPQAPQLEMLLAFAILLGRDDMAAAVHATLTAMAAGGIHDQVGGGFHRYSVDERWRIPHFEKMLYDNAQLLALYAMAHSHRPQEGHGRVAEAIVTYLQREIQSDDGLFYASQAADSKHGEGFFYTWDATELSSILSPKEYALFTYVYGVTEQGNFEGRNVLYQQCTTAEAAASLGLTPVAAEAMLNAVNKRLYALRSNRTKPPTDDKILTDWNALAIAALAEAGARLNERQWLDTAENCADALLAQMADNEGRVYHCRRGGMREPERFADDGANLAWALLRLYEAGGRRRHLDTAAQIAERLFADFATPDGALAMTAVDGEVLIHRPVRGMDQATPSANGAAARVAVGLYALTGEQAWGHRAEQLFRAFAGLLHRAPGYAPTLALAKAAFTMGCPKVQISGGADGALARAFWQGWFPLVHLGHDDDTEEKAVICAAGTCQPPLADVDALVAELHRLYRPSTGEVALQ